MPIYEYVCPNCCFKFELIRPASKSQSGAACPRCQSSANRVLSVFASVSKDAGGNTTPISGGAPSCGSCASRSCGTCGG